MLVRKISLIVLISLFCIGLHAGVRIVASAPKIVPQGSEFQLEYEVNTQNVKSYQSITKIPGFEILYGPSKSSSFSMQIINGHQSSVSSVTFGYTLASTKTGTFTMPRMTVNVDGQSYTSNAVTVKVVASAGGNSASSRNRNNNGYDNAVASKSAPGHISNKDLFITVTANKSKIYEQEPVLLTYRVYTRLNLTQLAGKMPDLKGFMVKEVPLTKQKSFSFGTYNGQNYYTTVWSQYVMFPQQTGKLTIPPIQFDGIVVFPDQNVDLLDAFFNGGGGGIQRKKSVMAPALNVNVLPLPQKPAEYSGAVGNFSIKTLLKTPKPRENETLDLQVQISGTGNVDLVKAPDVKFPSDFDVYPPKQNAQSNLSASGLTGTMTVDYIAVPKHKGTYTIPSIKFIYFDTSTNSYQTKSTQPITVEVAKGETNIYSDKQQEILARSDIRYIKTASAPLHHKEQLFWNRTSYWMCYLIVLIVFFILYIFLHRRAALKGDVVGRRVRGAGRLVIARLKHAKRLMTEGKTDEFYDETLHAMSGYVADKLNIPVSNLTKENIRTEFQSQQVPEELTDHFFQLQDECEQYRFAHSAETQKSTEAIYNETLQVISKLDSILKKKIKK